VKEVSRRPRFHPHVGRCEITRLMSLLSYVKHISYPLDDTNSIIDAQTKVLHPEELLRLTAMEAVLSKTLLFFAMMDARFSVRIAYISALTTR